VLSDAIGSVQEPLLSQGYALAQSTLNDFGTNCNDRLSAETLSMVKEYFIKRYGNPVHTIGTGGSGGAMQLHLIAQNYPGLLDGIIPMGSFPDVVTYLQWEADSNLLIDALQASRQSWTAGQKTAVLGYATWYQRRNRKDEGASCDSSIPIEWRYQRTANPNGVRCNEYDNEVNVFGRNPHTGFAWRPFDNVGVQYGIRALNRGEISTEQFIELNERVGGFDPQGAPSTSRAEADPEAVRLVYERGLLLRRGEGLSEIPIIDWRAYSDDLGGSVDGHFRFLSFVTRARLLAANGRTDNQVILVDPRESWFDWVGFRGASHFWGPVGQLVPEMDRWLDHIDLDQERGSRAEKIVRDKPPSLADSCMTLDGERIIEPASVDGVGRCNAIYPSHADPRLVAGAPLSDDILKCALKPIKMADYAQSLTEAQLIRLQAVFPKGVCDYTQPGIGQSVTWKTWQRF
jgi:hypothetical protein